MAYFCKKCGLYEVDEPEDLCQFCGLAVDPYQKTGQSPKKKNQAPIPVDPTVTKTVAPSGKRGGGGNAPILPLKKGTNQGKPVKSSSKSGLKFTKVPISEGIIRNVVTMRKPRSFLQKCFDTLFNGVPFAQDDDVTSFQVYPDTAGTQKNLSGHDCDQVLIYGKLSHGMASENNRVQVYGKRDSHHNIVAQYLINTTTGTKIVPQHSIKTYQFIGKAILTLIGVGFVCFGMLTFLSLDAESTLLVIIITAVILRPRQTARWVLRMFNKFWNRLFKF